MSVIDQSRMTTVMASLNTNEINRRIIATLFYLDHLIDIRDENGDSTDDMELIAFSITCSNHSFEYGLEQLQELYCDKFL